MSLKERAFSVYSLFFNLGAKRGVKDNRVGLVSMHNAHFKDSLLEVERAMGEGLEYLKVDRQSLNSFFSALRFVTLDAFKLGRSKYIFLNDNFMPLAKTRPNANTLIVQLWHGQGAFKKFGLDIEQPEKIRKLEIEANKKLDFVVCSSAKVRTIYSQAFGVDLAKVITSGTPGTDYYFNSENDRMAREHVYSRYPSLKNKYVVLYAPTFRDGKGDEELLNSFSATAVKSALETYMPGTEVEIVARLHPQVHGSKAFADSTDATDYDSVNELCIVADLLITDYSSVCMDFALQEKPCVFYAFDLDSYESSRNFYFDYESYVPGPVAKTGRELLDVLSNGVFESEDSKAKLKEFRDFNFDNPDGQAGAKLIKRIKADA